MKIIGSERMIDFDYLNDDNHPDFISHSLVSTGRAAIKCVFDSFERSIVLFPDFYCKSMLNPVIDAGHNIEFYHIDSNFNADINSIELSSDISHIFICDFFGFRDHALVQYAGENNLSIIIDRTHSILSDFEKTGIEIASFRKLFPVPDGGYFTADIDHDISSKYADFHTLKSYAKMMRYIHEKSCDNDIIEDYYVKYSQQSENLIDDSVCSISPLSLHILKHYPLKRAIPRRMSNYDYLHDQLSEIAIMDRPDDAVPQSMPVLIDRRDAIKLQLQDFDIYAPVLWRCSNEVSDRLLNLPCDEEYGPDDMERIVNAMRHLL